MRGYLFSKESLIQYSIYRLVKAMQGTEQHYRFSLNNEEGWRRCLQKEGFVVISQWLNKEECQNYVDSLWDIIQILADHRVNRKDPTTQVLSKNYPPVLHGGMIQYVAHSKTQWDLRKRAKLIFERLWKTNKLKSSFDGFCFMNGMRNYQKAPLNSFLHCDQSPTKDKVWSYQGVATLTDSGNDEGGFVVIPKSNHYHHQFFIDKGLGDYKKNWYLLSEEDKQKMPFSQPLKVNTKAGDFILFDSRTFHCNTVPRKKVLRVCTYICMLPANHVPEKTKNLRDIAVANRRTSNHHPGDGFRTFPALPRYLQNAAKFEKLLKEVNDCAFDEQIKQLI